MHTVLCGLLMGGADIIPGVSGGTVALVLGIYHRLIAAISQIGPALVKEILERRWRTAWQRCDGRFLAALGVGIGSGVLALAKLMRHLLENHHQYTMAVFFGLILGSTILVARRIDFQNASQAWTLAYFATAAAWLAFFLVGLPPEDLEVRDVGLWYVFLSGMIAICAMILPGVSGAYLLLVLGLYVHVTDIIDRLTRLQATGRDLSIVLALGSGCMVGLLGFSRLLRWLLDRWETVTMAVLCGLMVGSLRKVWPFQINTMPDAPFKERIYRPVLPSLGDAELYIVVALVLAGVAAVITLSLVATPDSRATPKAAEQSTEPAP